jgi:hypothetical protein
MTELHVYAHANAFKTYLTDARQAASWSPDAAVVLRVLEAASEHISNAMGGQHFGPVTQTRLYDLGESRNRRNPVIGGKVPAAWNELLLGPGRLGGEIDLGRWLISATTVNAYADSARTGGATALTAASGGSGDYLLEPYNQTPKTTLKLFEETAESLFGGQQTLEVIGEWGWQDRSVATGAVVTGTWAIGATEVEVVAGGGNKLFPGMIVLVDSEQIYIRAVQGDVLTIERAMNGTTDAAHTNPATVSQYIYPADVEDACLQIAANLWHRRNLGATQQVSQDGAPSTFPMQQFDRILGSLKHYRQNRSRAGVYF